MSSYIKKQDQALCSKDKNKYIVQGESKTIEGNGNLPFLYTMYM